MTKKQKYQRKSTLKENTQRKRTVIIFGENSLAKNISVPSGEQRKHTVKKDRKKTKTPRKKNRYTVCDTYLNGKKLESAKRNEEMWKRRKQH